MPASIAFRPIQADFKLNEDVVEKITPYCKFRVGMHSGKTDRVKPVANHAEWSDYVVIEKRHEHEFATLKIKDKAFLGFSRNIGEAKIDLEYVINNRKVVQSYDVYDSNGQVVAVVLLEIEYIPPI